MNEITEQELKLLRLIGHGEYDYALPDDDETVAALQALHRRGLVGVDEARIGDFIYPTEAGCTALMAAALRGGKGR